MSADNLPVSIIIPFHNRVNYIRDAVRSVFLQETGDIQLILVDDGSDDGSMEAAVEVWKKLHTLSTDTPPGRRGVREVLTLRIPRSGMPGAVRNRGVELADCPLIAFLDSDDIWLSHKLGLQLPLYHRISHTRETWLRYRPDSSNIAFWEETLTAETLTAGAFAESFQEVSQKDQLHQREGDVFADSLWKCILGPSTVVMEKELFFEAGGFREDLEVAEDYEFWLRVTATEPVAYIDKPCILKRAEMPDQNQLSMRYDQIEGFRLRALFDFLNDWDQRRGKLSRDQLESAWQVLERKNAIFQRGALKHGNRPGVEYSRMIESELKNRLL